MRHLIDDWQNNYLAVDATVLIEAFEWAMEELGLVDRADPATRLAVANDIIMFAKVGERDPVRLRDLALQAVRLKQRRPPPRIPGQQLSRRQAATGDIGPGAPACCAGPSPQRQS